MSATYQLPRYPAIRFFISRGVLIAALMASAILAAGLYAALAHGHMWAIPAGIAVAALLGGLMLCFVELLSVVAETLMPR